MDFRVEVEKRKQRRMGEIGELAYERFMAAKLIEDSQRRIEGFDIAIGEREAAITEIDQSIRDFETYKVIEASKPKDGDDKKTGASDGDKG